MDYRSGRMSAGQMRGRVSWRPEYSRRVFGRFVRWMPNGQAKIRVGSRIEYVDAGDLTWEMR